MFLGFVVVVFIIGNDGPTGASVCKLFKSRFYYLKCFIYNFRRAVRQDLHKEIWTFSEPKALRLI